MLTFYTLFTLKGIFWKTDLTASNKSSKHVKKKKKHGERGLRHWRNKGRNQKVPGT
jgi:hypothetical protein